MFRAAQRSITNLQRLSKMSGGTATKELHRGVASQADVLSAADPEQARLMAESVIQVDRDDGVIGPISKKDSHLVSNNLPLHRAFSLMLFDSTNRMLLQQRASTKVTFPSYWTNTVCSHPLHVPDELATAENDPVLGAKRAAIRKLSQELGVPSGSLKPTDLSYLTRIHYRAECDDKIWGEHEIDYLFFARADLELNPNPNEVDEVRYVTQHELKRLFTDATSKEDLRITPWFQHIMNNFAWKWWDALEAEGMSGLEKFRDTTAIHRMGGA